MPRSIWLLLSFLLVACEVAPWREQLRPWDDAVLAPAEHARATRTDGAVVVVAWPRLEVSADGAWLVGEWNGDDVRVPLAEIERLETRRPELMRQVARVVVVAVVVAIVICASARSGTGGGGFQFGGSTGSAADRDEPSSPLHPDPRPRLRPAH